MAQLQPDVSQVAESGWVRLCPLLEVTPTHPSAPDSAEVKTVKEIFEYFHSLNPKEPMTEFQEIFNKLATLPEPGETKLLQVSRAVKLLRIARQALETHNNTKKALGYMGIK